MVNNRENKRFVTNRRDDIPFSYGSRFVSFSFFLSLSLLISYSLEQSCQLETDFLLTYVNVAKSTLSKYGKYLFSSPLTTRVGYHVFRPIVQYLIKANMEGANSERTSEINRENLWLTVRRIRIL